MPHTRTPSYEYRDGHIFLNGVDIETCLVIPRKRHKTGYVYISVGGRKNLKSVLAHRYYWEKLVGPIPFGKFLDHLCRNRACINAEHLELATNRENVLRGVGPTAINARKEVCSRHGHPLSGANLIIHPDGRRECRECQRESGRNHMRRKRAVKRDAKGAHNVPDNK